MLLELFLTLNAPIFEFTYFLRLVIFPSLAIILMEKVYDENRVDEVNEGVAHIAMVCVINGKVEKVKTTFMVLLNFFCQHFHVIFVRNVLYHQCGSNILVIPNFLQVNVESSISRIG